jgi:hypothetical protein
MVERAVEPTIVRNFADVAPSEEAQMHGLLSDPEKCRGEGQYASPLCVCVLSVVRITGSNCLAKMHDSLFTLPVEFRRLFTSQRVWRSVWYAVMCGFWVSVVWNIPSAHGQTAVRFELDFPVCHVQLDWEDDDVLEVVRREGGGVLDVWQSEDAGSWDGVEVLDLQATWVPVDGHLQDEIESQRRSAVRVPWTWDVAHVNGQARLRAIGPVVRWSGGAWERLSRLESTLGSSPQTGARVLRDWPLQSVRAEGTWFAFATTSEGVHCLGYDEIVASGLNPEDVVPGALRLFGRGGQPLPMENDSDRPLDVPQQRVAFRGLDDGSFDPGDELCWYAPAHETWRWNPEDGWVHTSALWGDTAKWFLRVDAPASLDLTEIEAAPAFVGAVDEVRTSHVAYGVEEEHAVNLIKSGRNWFGQRLSALGANSTTWNVSVPNAVVGQTATVQFGAAMRTVGSGTASQLTYSFEGASAVLTDNLLTPSSLSYAKYVSGELSAPLSENAVQVLATFSPGTDDANAWVDYLAYQAPQLLVYSNGQFPVNGLPVNASGEAVASAEWVMGGATPDEVWDVTDPLEVQRVVTSTDAGNTSWRSEMGPLPKRFLAFRWSSVKRPVVLGSASNSNVHGMGEVDYVIVTVPGLLPAADSLAQIHALLGKRVAVVLQQDVFDAFSSGVSDPTAIKMLMMMLQDRAAASAGEVDPPKYLLLFGDASYQNRNVQGNGGTVVGHYSSESLQTTTSYISDDYFALTAEGQGERPEDLLQLGVGRIPAPDLESAWAVVGKVATYLGLDEGGSDEASCLDPNGSSVYGPWRNRVLFVSDDQDGNNQDGHRYMENSEEHSATIRANHNEYDVVKVYPDAYVQTNTPGGERYEAAAAEIARRVDEGALVVNYIGHGGERGWAHERILNLETIQSWSNLRRLPVFMTATCELFRYDDPDMYSAGEAILFNPEGGGVALLTTTRTVYSSGNQQVNRAFFETALNDSEGRCLGDIYKDTKNSEEITSHTNSRNFSLMGDPAMALAYPKERVFLTQVPDTMRSLDEVVFRGYVGNESGDTLSGFNGVLVPTVFDKQASVTTLDNDQSEGPFTYEVFQNILHKGLASVENGVFEFRFIVPRDINYAYGTGRVSCYALSETVDAHGFSESFVIGGTAENPLEDSDGPVLELFMNDTLFRAGDVVHEDPWLFARVFDASGINTSGNGIGHDAKAILDGDAGRPFVLNEYFVSDLDTYQSGTIRFPFQDLSEGFHDLELKVWDVANNSATASTQFVVASSVEVALLEVLAFPNPAVDGVTFRMTGNQACKAADVKLEVFSPTGVRVYEQQFEGEVLGFRDDVMSWDLKPSSGGFVTPGVYVFRVTWTNDFGNSAQYADKLVVLRPQ